MGDWITTESEHSTLWKRRITTQPNAHVVFGIALIAFDSRGHEVRESIREECIPQVSDYGRLLGRRGLTDFESRSQACANAVSFGQSHLLQHAAKVGISDKQARTSARGRLECEDFGYMGILHFVHRESAFQQCHRFPLSAASPASRKPTAFAKRGCSTTLISPPSVSRSAGK